MLLLGIWLIATGLLQEEIGYIVRDNTAGTYSRQPEAEYAR
jgi:hypothetical protein